MSVHINVNGQVKKIKNIYVNVNNSVKKVLKGYVGDANGVPKQIYKSSTIKTDNYKDKVELIRGTLAGGVINSNGLDFNISNGIESYIEYPVDGNIPSTAKNIIITVTIPQITRCNVSLVLYTNSTFENHGEITTPGQISSVLPPIIQYRFLRIVINPNTQIARTIVDNIKIEYEE